MTSVTQNSAAPEQLPFDELVAAMVAGWGCTEAKARSQAKLCGVLGSAVSVRGRWLGLKPETKEKG